MREATMLVRRAPHRTSLISKRTCAVWFVSLAEPSGTLLISRKMCGVCIVSLACTLGFVYECVCVCECVPTFVVCVFV
jgi:hypothetical protein